MEDQPVPPTPLEHPAREGFNMKLIQARAMAVMDGPPTDYTKGREGKTLTLKQDFFRQLAINKKKQQQAQGEQTKDERPTNPESE